MSDEDDDVTVIEDFTPEKKNENDKDKEKGDDKTKDDSAETED